MAYGHHRTTATTYLNDNVVICVLERILTQQEDELIAGGSRGEVIDGRVAFQIDTQDEFTAAIERLTDRRVTAFLSANQTTPGVPCELFVLDAIASANGAWTRSGCQLHPSRFRRVRRRPAHEANQVRQHVRARAAPRPLLRGVPTGLQGRSVATTIAPSRRPSYRSGGTAAYTGLSAAPWRPGCCASCTTERRRLSSRCYAREPQGRRGDDPLPSHPGDLAERVIAREWAASLQAQPRRLPEAQREVIVLAYYGQLTHAEIATQLALPPGTVKGRMRLGLQKLRAEIDRAVS